MATLLATAKSRATEGGHAGYFDALADHVDALARGGEVLLSRFAAEESDFIRFNRSAVRQATAVVQRRWTVSLVRGARRIDAQVALSGRLEDDRSELSARVASLRDGLADVPEDPYVLHATEPARSRVERRGAAPEAGRVIDEVLAAGRGLDLVGFYQGGPVHRGFSASTGIRHWHSVESFGFGWCLYHGGDKAVKTTYAGFEWDAAAFSARMGSAREQLALLAKPPKSLAPGAYRAYLTPAAMTEILGMLAWAGLGLKARETKQSALIRMIEKDARLSPRVTLRENTREGIAPAFQGDGFLRPEALTLIEAGRLHEPLVSPRSAREYGAATNGANTGEVPESLDLAAGDLPAADVLAALGTGIYIGNLWYLNFSDRSACRLTGMTRFASFWVENGAIRAPLNVMRFDDTIYRILGENLEALTAERDFIPDAETYEERSSVSARTPGALVRDFALTL